MHALTQNPKLRFPIAMGASIGIGHALFRGLTENLGPIVGLAVFLPAMLMIVLGIYLLLEAVLPRPASTQPSEPNPEEIA